MYNILSSITNMWNDIIDFIDNHCGCGAGYDSEGIFRTGTMLEEYQPKGELGKIIEEATNKYGAHDMMIFASLGQSTCCRSKGIPDPHRDGQDVLIRCLEGQVNYFLFKDDKKLNEPTARITLNVGETLFLPEGKWHSGANSKPRAVLSMAVDRTLGTEEVTYHWDNL